MPDHIKKLRRSCVTGTDIAAIVGQNPRKTALDIWMEKKNGHEINLSGDRVEAGLRAEPMIAEWYTDKTGIELTTCDFIQKGIFGGSVDRIPVDEKFKDLIVEIKTADGSRREFWGEEGTDEVPESYLIQCAWYLMLTERNRCDLAVLIGGNDFRIYTIYRNIELEKKLKFAAERFWARYITGDQTPKITDSDQFSRYLVEKYRKGNGVILEADSALYEKAKKLKETNDQIKSLEKVKHEIENEFKFLIGENEGIAGEGFKFLWPTCKDKTEIDYDGLVKELNASEDLIKKYTSTKLGSRRVNFKFIE